MRLVTYNIQYSKGKDGRYDLSRTAKAVKGTDIIALQEVERYWPRTGMVDQPAEIAVQLPGYYWVYGPAFDMGSSEKRADGTIINQRRQFGTMLLAKTPFLSSRLHGLPKTGTVDLFNIESGALEGVIEAGLHPLRVYSVHLSALSRRERIKQLRVLLDIHAHAPTCGGPWSGDPDIVDEDWSCGAIPPPMPSEAIMLGDFNFEPDGPEYDEIVGPYDPAKGRAGYVGGFVDAWVAAGNDESAGVTWIGPRGSPEMRIDYCFASASLANRVRKAWVDIEAHGSDHYPCWVDIDL